MKRTPLNRGTKQLSRTGRLNRSGKLRPRSAKTEELYRTQRRPLVERLLSERPYCERCGVRRSTDIHEVRTRARTGGTRGDLWLDEENCRALCRVCHTWIGDNPAQAEADGWLAGSTT